ncbi:MAG: hypothetical protein FRX49_07807 [Trebouxia sp. A1-2]|nr:MAG: hypothetical protein FRX49_07807 [Trebouxia sp. A1-2]
MPDRPSQSPQRSGRQADLRGAIALQHLEQHSCAQAKGEAYYQASSKDIQEPGKDSKHCSALQLYVFSQSLHTKSAWLRTEKAPTELVTAIDQSNLDFKDSTEQRRRSDQLVMHCILMSAVQNAAESKMTLKVEVEFTGKIQIIGRNM